MINKLIIIFILFNSFSAKADEIVTDIGLGVLKSGQKLSETKELNVGLQENLWNPFKLRGSIGGWLDSFNNRSSSLFYSGQLGYEVNNNGFLAGVFSGPCVITNTDGLLGGNLQFMSDFHLGIQDVENNYFGLMYRHISSAGLATPNIGRDFMGLEFRFLYK